MVRTMRKLLMSVIKRTIDDGKERPIHECDKERTVDEG